MQEVHRAGSYHTCVLFSHVQTLSPAFFQCCQLSDLKYNIVSSFYKQCSKNNVEQTRIKEGYLTFDLEHDPGNQNQGHGEVNIFSKNEYYKNVT